MITLAPIAVGLAPKKHSSDLTIERDTNNPKEYKYHFKKKEFVLLGIDDHIEFTLIKEPSLGNSAADTGIYNYCCTRPDALISVSPNNPAEPVKGP